MNKKFFNQYFKKQSELLNFDEKTIDELKKTSDILNKVRKRKKSDDIWKWWKRCNCKSFFS